MKTLKSPKEKPSPQKSPVKKNNKSVSRLDQNKSVSRLVSKSPFGSPSPTRNDKERKTSKILEAEDTLLETLKKIREKICVTLDAYVLIFETESPMRCLEHNSVLSLYCETEQKLLCANCIYKNSNHRLHKIMPIEKSYKSVARDVDLLYRHSEREVKWVNNSIKLVNDYIEKEEQNASSAILTLARKYDDLQAELSRSFEEARRNILIAMEGIRMKNEALLLELQFSKDIISRNVPFDWQNFDEKSSEHVNERQLLFDHVIVRTILEYGKHEHGRIEPNSKIKAIEQKELNRVQKLVDILAPNIVKNTEKEAPIEQH